MDANMGSSSKTGLRSLPDEIVLDILNSFVPTDKNDVRTFFNCRRVCRRMNRLTNTAFRGKLTFNLGTSHASFTSRMNNFLSTDDTISDELLSCFSSLTLDAQILDQKLPPQYRHHGGWSSIHASELSSPQLLKLLQDLSAFLRKIGPYLKSIELASHYHEGGPYYFGIAFSDRFLRVASVVLLYASMHGYLDNVRRLKLNMQCDYYFYYIAGTAVHDPQLEGRTGWLGDTDNTAVSFQMEEGQKEYKLPDYIMVARTWMPRFMGPVPTGPWDRWNGERRTLPLMSKLEVFEIPDYIPHEEFDGLPETVEVRRFTVGKDTIWPGDDPEHHLRDY